ncbi:hypothetical protein CB1_001514006 [Camelus ferus]|nr:hypothetical protein CB1_001514006 [Camelus ferus]
MCFRDKRGNEVGGAEEKLNLDDSQWEDIHVVTGALKMFFRELPEPLFPYSFFERFVEAINARKLLLLIHGAATSSASRNFLSQGILTMIVTA